MSEQIRKSWTIPISKIDAAKQQVFGWASVVEEGGKPVVDSQGDVITVDELEKAAYSFNVRKGIAGDNHERIGVGRLIESMVFTVEKQQALGIDLGKVGWWVGFHIQDPDTWAKVASGEYVDFSIGGSGRRVPA